MTAFLQQEQARRKKTILPARSAEVKHEKPSKAIERVEHGMAAAVVGLKGLLAASRINGPAHRRVSLLNAFFRIQNSLENRKEPSNPFKRPVSIKRSIESLTLRLLVRGRYQHQIAISVHFCALNCNFMPFSGPNNGKENVLLRQSGPRAERSSQKLFVSSTLAGISIYKIRGNPSRVTHETVCGLQLRTFFLLATHQSD